ncbi:Protein bric-a-brac 2 [Pseudolycoriella hygida]|uniref:Protein bric-a-brac 2 n=1 Tax=Pseudolycoriella hygida TaxID=35572 RepID=A0A9Q0MZY1_9DIPT|nr:Protein bric-a-brac 2 [Pseudolycoriella hygida]
MSETPPPESVTPVTVPNSDQQRPTTPSSKSQNTSLTHVSPKDQQPSQQTQSSTLSSTPSNQSNQQFCLRWNNYQTNLTSVFDQLLQNESFVDVTLACDGHSIKAHKMVLSACSPYFQSLFFDNPCQHPIVIMRDVKWPELKAAVEFMYKGEINVSQDQIGPLLHVAEMLKIRGLADVNSNDQELITPQQSSALPQISTVAKKPRLTPKDWDSVSGGNGDATASTRHRKRRWPSTENSSTAGSPPVMPSTTPDNLDAQSPIPPNSISSMSHPPSTPTPIPPFPIPSAIEGMGLSSLGMTHSDDMEIKPGIAEMIREEEREHRVGGKCHFKL